MRPTRRVRSLFRARSSVFSLLILGLVGTGCTGGAADRDGWTVQMDTLPGGVPRVTNLPPEAGIDPMWTIEPELTIGSISGDGPEIFGTIKGVAPLADGSIAILDSQAQEVRIFGADGGYLRTLGTRGGGPGEFMDANGILPGDDGLLRVHDPVGRRISLFHPETGFLSATPIVVTGLRFIWDAAADSSGRFHEAGTMSVGNVPWDVVKIFDGMGVWADTVFLREREVAQFNGGSISGPADGRWIIQTEEFIAVFQIPFWPQGISAIDPRGYFWSKPANENVYSIVQTSYAGDTILVAESRRTAVPVPPAEIDSVRAMIRERAGGESLDLSVIPTERPIVESIFLDNRGRIWVRVHDGGDGTTFDIFSREGRYEGTVTSPLAIVTAPAPVVVDDRIYAVYTDELGVQYVLRGRIDEFTASDGGD